MTAATSAPRQSVLVVDDDPAVTRMLELALRTLDVDVLTANDGARALELIAARRPDAVLLDVMMPGMDGAAVARVVRESEELAGTPILLYSNLDEPTLAAKARECGADAFLAKTLGPARVVRELNAWMTGRKQSSRPAPAGDS